MELGTLTRLVGTHF